MFLYGLKTAKVASLLKVLRSQDEQSALQVAEREGLRLLSEGLNSSYSFLCAVRRVELKGVPVPPSSLGHFLRAWCDLLVLQ